ncbi:MAG: hypothetical protein ACLSFO_05720 [Anaerovoracaceae bacterium]
MNEKTETKSRIGLMQFYFSWQDDKKKNETINLQSPTVCGIFRKAICESVIFNGRKMKIFKSCGKKKFAVIAAVMLAVLSVVGCSGGDDRIETIPAETAEVETEKYENEDFSMEIPKGWKVTYGGSGMYHSIRVQDPDEPLNQMFVLLKADALLHSEGQKAWQYNYDSGSSGAYLFTLAPCQRFID